MGLSKRATLLTACVCLCLLAVAGVARGEIDRKGTLQATFSGDISPQKLPRGERVPIAVLMGGKITTTDRSEPPQLEQIVLEINSQGVIDNTGLPTCSITKLNSLSSAAARKACAGALVGHGNVTSRVYLPNQGAFASSGDMLAFNGRVNGHQAVLAQVASEAPLPLTYVIAFEITKQKGRFGTKLVGTLPPIASEYGYISSFSMSLSRRYTSHGKQRSFASASCPAPKGTNFAPFPFAKASYEFAGGITLGATLIRDCKVRN
jgi:hypothetical protein